MSFDEVDDTTKPKNVSLPVNERRLHAVELRAAGLTNPEIAHNLGVTVATVRQYLAEGLDQVAIPQVENWRTLETIRLEKMHAAIWDRAKEGDFRAIDRVLRIAERRAKLLGLDTPIIIPKDENEEKEEGPRVLEVFAASPAQDTVAKPKKRIGNGNEPRSVPDEPTPIEGVES